MHHFIIEDELGSIRQWRHEGNGLTVLTAPTPVAPVVGFAVVYRVGETAVRDGVRAGEWWFPGFPLPGGDERDRFAVACLLAAFFELRAWLFFLVALRFATCSGPIRPGGPPASRCNVRCSHRRSIGE